ncbi:MAG: hypothetical protein K6F63_06975 [Lachnospiraceae bacterium]|nr:hypothetical protein [Lachnospiraceae bacterium]
MIFGFLGALAAICVLFFIGFCFSSFLFGFVFWLFIKLPIAIVFAAVGLVLCCTIILAPLGIMSLKIAGGMFVPCL